MATSLSTLLKDPTFDAQSQDSLRRLTQATGFQVPDREDIHAALAHGAGPVRLLLAAPKLNEAQRRDLASEGLLEWSKKVLDNRDSLNMAQALVSAGADVNVSTPSGRTPVAMFAEQLGRIEAEEAALKKANSAALETGGVKTLRAAWGLLEANGATLTKAKELRESAYGLRQSTLHVAQWRNGRAATVAAPAPVVARPLWRP